MKTKKHTDTNKIKQRKTNKKQIIKKNKHKPKTPKLKRRQTNKNAENTHNST